MKAYLLIDFGSTYTKITCVDIESEELLATAKDITTVEDGVRIGYDRALTKLKEKLPSNIKFEKVLACSSAAGGLKMIAIGLGKSLTAEASKRAALGAGARILETYSYELTDKDIKDIQNLNPDIILLSGGTDHGNKRNIIYNASQLNNIDRNIPIVVAGNIDAKSEIEKIFANRKNYIITENVMPKVNDLNAFPARQVIRKIFMDKIVKAKGIDNIKNEIDGILMPTPAAVIKGAELLSLGSNMEKGLGDLIIVDIGGATTDIHSIAKGSPQDGIRFEGLKEPLAKRTVEGDLGMRYSALSMYEAVGEKEFQKHLNQNIDVYQNCKMRSDQIKFIPKTQFDYEFDKVMASLAVKFAIKRHSGKIRKEFTSTRYIYYQKGKNLKDVKIVIGTGGVLVHSKEPAKILSNVEIREKDILAPQKPDYYIDSEYIISAMGLLGTLLPDVAIRIMKKYLRKVN